MQYFSDKSVSPKFEIALYRNNRIDILLTGARETSSFDIKKHF